MKARTFFGWAGMLVLTSTVLAVVVIAAFAIWYLMGLRPVRVTVTGRVVDGAGHGIGNAAVEATALPISSPESEGTMEPPGKRFCSAVTHADGRFQMKGVSLGVNAAWDKGGYLQEYTLVIGAEGYRPVPMRLAYDPGRTEKHIGLGDIVLERLAGAAEAGTSGR